LEPIPGVTSTGTVLAEFIISGILGTNSRGLLIHSFSSEPQY
jgi:hypothetical protein